MTACAAGLFARRNLAIFCAVLWWIGSVSAIGGTTPFPNVSHVIHISLDGMGGIYLSNYLAQAPGDFPTFHRLRRQGAGTLNARCDYHISVTEPNHASILTGRPVWQQPTNVPFIAPHGLDSNYDPGPPWTLHTFGNPAVPYKASVFDVAHDHGLTTAFFAGKEKFDLFIRSYDEVNGAPDEVDEDNGPNKIDFSTILDWSGGETIWEQSSNLVSLVTNHLTTVSPRYCFVHVADLDITGHFYGWGSDEYRDTVRYVDEQLRRILAAIEASPALSNHTALVITADHGGGDIYGSHEDASDPLVFTIPLLLWGPGVPAEHDLHELFSNRTEPGGEYLDYDAPAQPLRNGDSGNLALTLLGLPPIPGSCLVPEFRIWLSLERRANGVVLSWPITDTTFDLEWSDVLASLTWHRVNDGIIQENGFNMFVLPNALAFRAQFFRLSRAEVK